MPNCIIKGIQDKIWIEYSDYDGELEIDAIYLDSDKNRTDVYDYLSKDVIDKAYESIREDWEELQAYLAHEKYKTSDITTFLGSRYR